MSPLPCGGTFILINVILAPGRDNKYKIRVPNNKEGAQRRPMIYAYLIFVTFFTLAKFLENKIYTENRQFFALNL